MSPCGVEIVPTRAKEFSAPCFISNENSFEVDVDTSVIVSEIDSLDFCLWRNGSGTNTSCASSIANTGTSSWSRQCVNEFAVGNFWNRRASRSRDHDRGALGTVMGATDGNWSASPYSFFFEMTALAVVDKP